MDRRIWFCRQCDQLRCNKSVDPSFWILFYIVPLRTIIIQRRGQFLRQWAWCVRSEEGVCESAGPHACAGILGRCWVTRSWQNASRRKGPSDIIFKWLSVKPVYLALSISYIVSMRRCRWRGDTMNRSNSVCLVSWEYCVCCVGSVDIKQLTKSNHVAVNCGVCGGIDQAQIIVVDGGIDQTQKIVVDGGIDQAQIIVGRGCWSSTDNRRGRPLSDFRTWAWSSIRFSGVRAPKYCHLFRALNSLLLHLPGRASAIFYRASATNSGSSQTRSCH